MTGITTNLFTDLRIATPRPTPPGLDVPELRLPDHLFEWTGPTFLERPPISVDDVTDTYMDLYDHSGDGSIDISMGQQWDVDERIVGNVGNVHTIVQFLRGADRDGDQRVTRAELRTAIAGFDLRDAAGRPGSDGMLHDAERGALLQEVAGRHSVGADSWDDRGVAQTVTVDGKRRRNDAFDRALPEFMPLD